MNEVKIGEDGTKYVLRSNRYVSFDKYVTIRTTKKSKTLLNLETSKQGAEKGNEHIHGEIFKNAIESFFERLQIKIDDSVNTRSKFLDYEVDFETLKKWKYITKAPNLLQVILEIYLKEEIKNE